MKVQIMKSTGMQEYQVPTLSPSMTVMDVLDYVYTHLDHSLAYYRHSACNQGICARCAVKLDGKTVLACAAQVPEDTASIVIAPSSDKVVRDLVVDRS